MSFVAHVSSQRHVPNRRGELTGRSSSESAIAGPYFRTEFVPSSPQLAGFPPPTGQHGPEPGSAGARPLSMAWITDDLIEETRRVWSPMYGRVLATEEAVEILMNVKQFAEVLLRAGQEGRTER